MGGETNLRKRENKWISTGKTGVGDLPKEKRKQMYYYRYQQGWGTNLRKRETKWIRTGKNRGGETNLRKRENK